jgi:uncharacterized protein YecT (DUF1311 family)
MLALFAAIAAGGAEAPTQADMDAEAASRLARADEGLNDAYDHLMAKVSPAGREKLRAAERAWIRYRDLECDFETLGSADGSAHPMALAGCEERLTRRQTAALRAQLACPAFDVDCGGQ